MKKTVLSLLFLLPFFSFAANNNTITVNQAQPQFTITLPGSPGSTGYSWFLTNYNKHLIQFVSSYFQEYKHPASIISGRGDFTFTFKVLSAAFNMPQTTELTFICARPWEMNQVPPAQKQQYTINIVK